MIMDVCCLVKLNPSNCTSLLGIPEFQFFLLDVLYDYQMSLYNIELKNISGIWDFGTNTHTVLIKHALLNDPEGYKRLINIFTWVETKRTVALQKPNPIKYEKGASYLLRHLWQNLLESLFDSSHMIRPSLNSNLWRNLIQITYFTQDIITSAYHESILKVVNNEGEEEYISSLGGVLNKLTPDEDFPYSKPKIINNLC